MTKKLKEAHLNKYVINQFKMKEKFSFKKDCTIKRKNNNYIWKNILMK